MRTIGFVPVAALALVLVGTTGALPIADATAAQRPAAPSDFNGDGYADLAIGAPAEAIGGTGRGAGGVNVLYGSALGLTAAGDQTWSQDSPGIKGKSEGHAMPGCCDRFGTSTVSGDLNGDGYADLAITSPDEGFGGDVYSGVVNVLYGSSHGLTAAGDMLLTGPLIDPDIRGFGWTIAAGDLNGDGFDDLVVGASGYRNLEGPPGRGWAYTGGAAEE